MKENYDVSNLFMMLLCRAVWTGPRSQCGLDILNPTRGKSLILSEIRIPLAVLE